MYTDIEIIFWVSWKKDIDDCPYKEYNDCTGEDKGGVFSAH